MKKILWGVGIGLVVVGVVLLALLRFSLGGPEDTWICQDGEWVAHGNPLIEKPKNSCERTTEATTEPIPAKQKQILIFFSNSKKTDTTDCALVFGVQRTIELNSTPYEQALKELFKGPTQAEKNEGYSSFFTSKTSGLLKKITVVDGIAYIELFDPRQLIPNASTSCGSQQLLASIKQTLMHDGEIGEVVFAIEGDQQSFYDWLQIGCPNQDTDCKDPHF